MAARWRPPTATRPRSLDQQPSLPSFHLEEEARLHRDRAVAPAVRARVLDAVLEGCRRGEIDVPGALPLDTVRVVAAAARAVGVGAGEAARVERALAPKAQCEVDGRVGRVDVPADVLCADGLARVDLHGEIAKRPPALQQRSNGARECRRAVARSALRGIEGGGEPRRVRASHELDERPQSEAERAGTIGLRQQSGGNNPSWLQSWRNYSTLQQGSATTHRRGAAGFAIGVPYRGFSESTQPDVDASAWK